MPPRKPNAFVSSVMCWELDSLKSQANSDPSFVPQNTMLDKPPLNIQKLGFPSQVNTFTGEAGEFRSQMHIKLLSFKKFKVELLLLRIQNHDG
jgi:hypothetical protein